MKVFPQYIYSSEAFLHEAKPKYMHTCILTCIHTPVAGGTSTIAQSTLPFAIMVTVEAIFYGYCLLQHQVLNHIKEPEPMTRDVVDLWSMCLTNVPDAREFLRVGFSLFGLVCWCVLLCLRLVRMP